MLHYTDFDKSYKFDLDRASNKNSYCNNIFVLDIETSSVFVDTKMNVLDFDYSKNNDYYSDMDRVGFCYIWQFSIDNNVYYGRYLDELNEFITTLSECTKGRKMIVYVHNLAYEFQFLRNIFEFEAVFARQSRKPISCKISDMEVIFKCSLMLSNMSLENIPKQYNLKINKKVGQLDYLKTRHSKTDLTPDELEYCEYDNLVVYEYIKLMLNEYKKLSKIPLTSTSKIRMMFKKHLQDTGNKAFAVRNWKSKIALLSPDYEVFTNLVKCFSGGYTHANSYFTKKVLDGEIKSVDFTSSYPAVMLMEKFPNGIFYESDVKLKELDTDNKAYMLTLRFTNIRKKYSMSYISANKLIECKNIYLENGRLISADDILITITEQDYEVIKRVYDYDEVILTKAYECTKNYLPKKFIEFIIKLYKNKNNIKKELKILEKEYGKISEEYREKEVEYNLSKAYLNSLYGMCVTNYITDEILFNDEWNVKELNEYMVKDKLYELKEKEQLLLPYQWGVWITAYARKNLWLGIEFIDEDVIYCDTDSIKHIGDYSEFIREYNFLCDDKVRNMCSYYCLDANEILGIGYFDNDGEYTEFITYGAKKYAYRDKKDNKLHITISGVNKRTGVEALKDNISNFKKGLLFDYNTSGKLMRTYNDTQPCINVTDYKGNDMLIDYKYGICLYPTTYLLGITDEFEDVIEKASIGCKLLDEI